MKKYFMYANRVIKSTIKNGIMYTLRRARNILKQIAHRRKLLSLLHVPRDDLDAQRNRCFQNNWLISILTPLYNTPESFLVEMIQSVQAQTYQNWELVLADGSTDSKVGEICLKIAQEDKRIVYKKLSENKGISENTNECIRLARGDFFGLLDHDDLLAPTALYESMCEIERGADFTYSDESVFADKIDNIVYLKIKADYSRDELRAHNYICHFVCFSKELLSKTGPYRKDFDGSQDHDMVLRLSEYACKIVHIPKILYYWRMHPESVSYDLSKKMYAVDAAIKAVQENLDRTGDIGTVSSSLPYLTIYKVDYEIIGRPLVNVIIHGASSHEQARTCEENIHLNSSYKNLNFIHIDNLSNTFIADSDRAYHLFIHASLEHFTPDWIEQMLMHAQRKSIGAVGIKTLYSNGKIHNAGISLFDKNDSKLKYWYHGISQNEPGYEACLHHIRNTMAVWAGCFMVKASLYSLANGFTDSPSGYEGVDLCIKLRDRGVDMLWSPYAEARFAIAEDTLACGKANIKTSVFFSRWQAVIANRDPYYSVWFSDLKIF